jgi:hypothetical protein
MLSIKKIHFLNPSEKVQLEQAMRKYASKRNSALDFLPAQTDFKTEKKFLGYENQNALQFTRLRSSFEKLLPKLIVRISKSDSELYYEVRLSWSSIIPIAFFVIMFPLLIWGIISGAKDYQAMLGISIICIGYPLWTLAELHFTKCKIEEALNDSKNVAVIPDGTNWLE